MRNEKLLIIISLFIVFTLILAGLIGAIIRLINIPAILISLILIAALIIQKDPPWWRKILEKFIIKNVDKRILSFNPKNKQEAADQSLKSIQKLLSLIKDNVATEGLRQEKERVSAELKRGDLVVVVFGVGSSGKTSLIRALLNEIVGEVSPAMGATRASNSYRLKLRGLRRGIKIIDTPGILEGGEEGINRKERAIQKARNADLIIVVIDSDLRAAEFEVIKALASVGKRIFLILNKIDLRGDSEEIKLIKLLTLKCKEFIYKEDIMSTAAAPQSVPIPGSRPLQPSPEIDQLVKRLARVLHDEGEELIADNILLQCRNLGNEGKKLLNRQRTISSRRCVDRYSWISSGVVILTPLPVIDMLGAAAVNAQMVIEIAKVYGVKMTKERAQELAIAVAKSLATLGLVKGGLSLIGTTLSLNLPTFVVGKILQGITSAWLTRIAGASFITFFQQDQDWGDGGIQEVVQHHYNLNRREENFDKFIDAAFDMVIKPLKRNKYKQLPPHRRPRKEEAS